MTDYLYITEYADPPVRMGNMIAAGAEPRITDQKIAIGGSSVASATFNAATKFIRVNCTAVCSINFGVTASVTAAVTNGRLAANQTEFFVLLAPGADCAVAVIANT